MDKYINTRTMSFSSRGSQVIEWNRTLQGWSAGRVSERPHPRTATTTASYPCRAPSAPRAWLIDATHDIHGFSVGENSVLSVNLINLRKRLSLVELQVAMYVDWLRYFRNISCICLREATFYKTPARLEAHALCPQPASTEKDFWLKQVYSERVLPLEFCPKYFRCPFMWSGTQWHRAGMSLD